MNYKYYKSFVGYACSFVSLGIENADNPPVFSRLFVLPGRVLQEQLCELTRLVLKLPEVDGLFQRAGLQATLARPDPASVLEMFVKVTGVERIVERSLSSPGTVEEMGPPAVLFPHLSALMWAQALGSVYNGLQVLSERSSMVTRALNYIGGIMKYIKPSLTSKNQEGLKLVFWAVGRCDPVTFRSFCTIAVKEFQGNEC